MKLSFFITTISVFQIFLRVAEETGVDAEPVLQSEPPLSQRTSAGQRVETQQAEQPETGIQSYSQSHSSAVNILNTGSMNSQYMSPVMTVCLHTAARKEKASYERYLRSSHSFFLI